MSLDPTFPRRHAARPLRAVRLPRRAARLLLALALSAALLAGGWLWLRDSSFVRVRDVEITGATSSQGGRIRAALEAVALDMSTLHVREGALRAAVRPFPSVSDLRIESDFPHRLTIEVLEHRPVAVLRTGGQRVAATASGLLLRGMSGSGLPAIRLRQPPTGARVTDRRALAALAAAAAAPGPLADRLERAWWGRDGLSLDLRNGPDLIFGDGDSAEAKWAAAARVLAEPGAAGATYLDVRVPGRVAAGGLAPIEEEEDAAADPSATAPDAATAGEAPPQELVQPNPQP